MMRARTGPVVAALVLAIISAATPSTAVTPSNFCSPLASPALVFSHGAHLFSVCADGTGLTQLTHGRAFDQQPAWSPNRQLIAFARQVRTGATHIYVMRADGTGLRRITSGHKDDFLPAWSPNGRRLSFTRGVSTLKTYIIHVDGSHLRYVTQGLAPAWSPDGGWVAVSRVSKAGVAGIFLVRTNGTHLMRITPKRISAYAADWSPDGNWLAFQLINPTSGDPPQRKADIAVIQSDGTHLQRVTDNHDGVDAFPAWSPNGRDLAFDRSIYDAAGTTVSDTLETVRLPAIAASNDIAAGQPATPVGDTEGSNLDW